MGAMLLEIRSDEQTDYVLPHRPGERWRFYFKCHQKSFAGSSRPERDT